MIIFLYGQDSFRSRRRVREMVEKFQRERDPQGMNVVEMDCVRDDANVLQEVLATPFLAERRMVVLKQLLDSKQYEVASELAKRIEENNLPESNVIIFWETREKAPQKKELKQLFQLLEKQQFVEQFSPMSAGQLRRWVSEEVEKRGAHMTRDAALHLQQHASEDGWRLSTIIDQLVSYRSGAEITAEDVGMFVGARADDNIFNLVDAILARKSSDVVSMMREQYRGGKDAGYIFAMILRQVRILLELKDAMDRGENPGGLAKKMGVHPFVIKKSTATANQYSLPLLKRVYEQLLDIDEQTKTGQGDQSLLLDLFVARLCAV